MSERGTWTPSLGAIPDAEGTSFRVWAPRARNVEAVIEGGPAVPLLAGAEGHHERHVGGVRPGALYRLRVDGAGPFPDPASRFQPYGVHGPSQVVDPASYAWSDRDWPGLSLGDLVLYELHVGTFSPEGTFDGVREHLGHVASLGATAVELMPVADFPGRRNWGYDGVAPFSPARCYGAPDDLRRLVDEAHRLGLGVFLDVVYNHLGPDGNYLSSASPHYFTSRHRTPWGDALNFDDQDSDGVRAYFVENALHWIREYHIDGLRLDATHAIVDDSPRHILADIAERVHLDAGRPALIVAEDDRNLAALVRPREEGGYGLDAVWADDLHHELRVALAGDKGGYFGDFSGSVSEIATTLRQGWLFTGQPSKYWGPRGTDPAGVPLERFIVCLQNHDQVGNRALGDRLNHVVDPARWRAAVALLLLAPETPLLFMGQEWAASSPFLYFTDHEPSLGRLVTEGRRREFAKFEGFAEPARRDRIPDPQALASFERSRLRWEEVGREPFASCLRLHGALLSIRREEVLRRRSAFSIATTQEDALVLSYGELEAAIRLRSSGEVRLPDSRGSRRILLTTEDPPFVPDPARPVLSSGAGAAVHFRRPGAVVLISQRLTGA